MAVVVVVVVCYSGDDSYPLGLVCYVVSPLRKRKRRRRRRRRRRKGKEEMHR